MTVTTAIIDGNGSFMQKRPQKKLRTFVRLPAFASLVLYQVLPLTACSSLGPKPNLQLIGVETLATQEVVNILALPTIGTQVDNPDTEINKAVAARAYELYGDSLLLPRGLTSIAKTIDLPPSAAELMPVNWDLAFYRWVLNTQKKLILAADPAAMPLNLGKSQRLAKLTKPEQITKKPLSSDDLERLSDDLRKHNQALKQLKKAHGRGDPKRLLTAANQNKAVLAPLETLFQYVIQRFKITYVLASVVIGSDSSYANDKPIHLFVALINPRSGQFRYIAHSVGKKSDAPTTYAGLISLMALNLFDQLEDDDDMPL